MSGREPAVIRSPAEMAAWSDAARARGERIAFVPTMGALHEGHVSLLREGRRRGDKLALSIFVNPTQFGPKEDLSRYPRDLPGDLAKAASVDTDVAYCPEPGDVYPPGFQTYVQVREVELGLDGGSRPGHFVGVATVVCKLFNVVRPHVALFGEKDFQQLAVVRRMVADLELGVEILGMPIVREPDGLAMSSRNAYLDANERAIAPTLHRVLRDCAARIAAGDAIARVVAEGWNEIEAAGFAVDYLEARNAQTLARAETLADGPLRLLVAARLGKTRLIDNVAV